MTEELDLKDPVEKKKPGPKAKESGLVDKLNSRIANLEAMIAHLSAHCGQRNMPVQYGLKPWDPTPKDMNRYKK